MSAPHPHRGGECRSCEGSGRDVDALDGELWERADDGDADALAWAPECDACEGTGHSYWAWQADDESECDHCPFERQSRRAIVPVATDEDEDRICWPCALAAHARLCGCDAEGWSTAPAPSGVVVGRPETYPAEGEPVGGAS